LKKYGLHIILVFCLGLFIAPGISYACGTKTGVAQKASCSKTKAKKLSGKHLTAKHACTENESTNPCGKSCGDHCGHGPCKCTVSCTGSVMTIPARYTSVAPFTALQDQETFLPPAHISPGFYSVWLPPKIS
jgi:hypothetical protein